MRPASVLPCTLKPPNACTDCGVRPTCPHTGIDRSTRKRTVSASHSPPSIFTICAPARISSHRVRVSVLARAERAERHVGDDQRALAAACHRRRVIRDVRKRHGQRRAVSLQHVAERIADQHHIDARAVEQRREARVVARQHCDSLACFAHRLKLRDGNRVAAGFLQIRHDLSERCGASASERDHAQSDVPLTKNSLRPRIDSIRSTSNARSACESSGFRCSAFTVRSGVAS